MLFANKDMPAVLFITFSFSVKFKRLITVQSYNTRDVFILWVSFRKVLPFWKPGCYL